jgi:hypothetical protein
VSSSPPCARQQDIHQAATQDEIRVSITFFPTLVAGPLQLSFLLHHSARALGQQHPTDTSRLHAAAIHTPFLRRFSFSFVTCTLSIQSPSPASPRSPYYCIHNIASRQSSAHVFKTAILLVEEGIASDDQFLQSIPSLLLSFALPARPFVSPLPAAL